MRAFLGLSLALILGACSTPQMMVTRLGPSDPTARSIPPDSVWVFVGKERVLPRYQTMARLSLTDRNANGSWLDPISVQNALLEEAGKLGADALIAEEVGGFPFEGPAGEWTWGTALAVRFSDGDLERIRSVARRPRDMEALALAPMALPVDLPVEDSVVAALTALLGERLQSNGFPVLPVEVYDSVRQEVDPEGLDPADPLLSLKEMDWTRALDRRVLPALRDNLGTDGYIFPEVQVVEAFFEGDEASWDGVTQKVGKTRSFGAKLFSGILNAILFNKDEIETEAPPPTGSLWALSLEVRIENNLGATVYAGRGGIELLEKADFEGGIWIGDPQTEDWTPVEIPPEQRLTKEQRVERAVRIALRDLR